MSAKKRMRKNLKPNNDWNSLLKNINFNEYISDVDRGILKFVNKGFYSQYKLFKISLNDLVPYPRAIMAPSWGNLITWYEKMYNCKLKDYDNLEKVIKADYDNIYNLYFCSPSLTGRMYSNNNHLISMIDNNATKCINLLFRCNVVNKYDINNCFDYIAEKGNRNMFIFFMNKINNDLEKYIHIDQIMHTCISERNENILELLVYTYDYEPPKSIVKRVNGPHFSCGLVKAIIDRI